MDFWHNSYTFQMIMFFQQTFMYSHIYACLNEKLHPNVFWEFTWMELHHIKLKWDNELCNKWSSISSNLVIIWMVFEIYLHFVIYHDDYNFFTIILFNNLILISKVEFFYNLFFGFWTTLLQVWLQKNLLILTW